MSISLIDHQHTLARVARIAGNLMAQPVTDVKPVSQGGANSRVYRLSCPSGDYVMKFYFRHPQDARDRLDTEFRSLSFLWKHGIRQVPQPLRAWVKQSCALYALVKGDSPAGKITGADIDQAAGFLSILKGLTKSLAGKEFAPASEASFCTKDIVNSLRRRLKRFYFEEKKGEYLALREYLQKDFTPLLEAVETWSKKCLTDHGVSWEQELLEHYRTLSPSDFGFHNALRTSTGTMVFLDFEYFGWDDPAKLISDFLWHPHPAMSMSEDIKMYFVHRMSVLFGQDPHFKARLKSVFPLFGLKWCLILLNEFIATDAQRRDFARPLVKNKTAVRLEQLVKAKRMSEKIKTMYKDFPYGN